MRGRSSQPFCCTSSQCLSRISPVITFLSTKWSYTIMTGRLNYSAFSIIMVILFFNKCMGFEIEEMTNSEGDNVEIPVDDTGEEMLPKADPLSMLEHGMNLAGKGIGLLTSQGIFAQMISSLTSAVKKNKDRQEMKRDGIDMTGPVSGIMDQLLKILRLDSNNKLQAVALNAVVFIAQMIDNSLAINADKIVTGKTRADNDNLKHEAPDGSPLKWVLQDMPENVKKDLILSRQENLPEQIMSTLEENPSVGNCIRHLVCRLSPVIWGMQKATKNLFLYKESMGDKKEDEIDKDNQNHNRKQKKTPLQLMFSDMPTIEQYAEHMKYCQNSLPPCISKR